MGMQGCLGPTSLTITKDATKTIDNKKFNFINTRSPYSNNKTRWKEKTAPTTSMYEDSNNSASSHNGPNNAAETITNNGSIMSSRGYFNHPVAHITKCCLTIYTGRQAPFFEHPNEHRDSANNNNDDNTTTEGPGRLNIPGCTYTLDLQVADDGRLLLRREFLRWKSKEDVPLPIFSLDLLEKLQSDVPLDRKSWLRTVEETAKFYLHRYFRKPAGQYAIQLIGQRMYQTFPGIGTPHLPGLHPWSTFSRSLSQKIRSERFLAKRKIRFAHVYGDKLART